MNDLYMFIHIMMDQYKRRLIWHLQRLQHDAKGPACQPYPWNSSLQLAPGRHYVCTGPAREMTFTEVKKARVLWALQDYDEVLHPSKVSHVRKPSSLHL